MKRRAGPTAGRWGRCPQTPGFTAWPPKWQREKHQGGRSRPVPLRLLSRRSGCVPAEPYPPLSSVQSGATQPRRTMIFHRTALTPLTLCLTPGVHCTPYPRRRVPHLSASCAERWEPRISTRARAAADGLCRAGADFLKLHLRLGPEAIGIKEQPGDTQGGQLAAHQFANPRLLYL